MKDLEQKFKDLPAELKNFALESTSCGVVITDVQSEDNPMIYVNPGFEKVTGYSIEEVIGKNCRFLQGDERDQPQLDIIRHAIASGEGCTVIVRNFRKDGTLFYNELIISPIEDSKGKVTHFIGIQNDVTEREIASPSKNKQKPSKIAVKDYKEGSIRLLDPSEIIYVAKENRQSVIHTEGESYPTYFSIEKLEAKLSDNEFYKASQSALVNINYIEHMIANGDGTYDIILKNQKSASITTSRSGAKNILKDLQI